MQLSRKLLIADYRFPTLYAEPASYTTQELASTSGANYTLYTVLEDGWYRVSVQGGGGGSSNSYAGSSGGKVEKNVYLYKGMKCLLWSGANGPSSSTGGVGANGFPGTQNNTFGGYGATRTTFISHGQYSGEEVASGSSGGGGSGKGSSQSVRAALAVGGGGAGSGFIAGFTDVTLPSQTYTVGSMTLDINRSLAIGSVVTYTCIPTYLICGGGGGASGTTGTSPASGGGGGAFGSGGTTTSPQVSAQAGPAGSWGKGADGGTNRKGGDGAWAFIDWSKNGTGWGTGGGEVKGNGFCKLYKIIPN